MRKSFCFQCDPTYLQGCRILLPVVWCLGLFLGIAFSCCSDTFSSLMRVALWSDVSIVGLATVILLPYLLTAVAVFISQPILILSVAFCKAFLFAACGSAIALAFGYSGWLIRMLLQFSDCTGIPVLYLLWNRCLNRDRMQLIGAFTAALALLFVLGSIDHWVIAPFVSMVR